MRCLLILAVAGCPAVPDEPLTSSSQPPPTAGHACENRVTYMRGDRVATGVFAYDASGQLIAYDEVYGGSPRFSFRRHHDDRGRRIEERTTVRGLGPVHRVARWRYDDADRVVEATYDLDGDVTTTELAYDADGRLARRATHGRYVSIATFAYAGVDPLVITQHHGDGVANPATRYTFAGGRIARSEHFDAGGTATSSVAYHYDADRLVRVHSESADRTWSTEYLWADGRVVHAAYIDDPPQHTDFTYDEAGRLVRRAWHTGQGFDVVTTIAWGALGVERVERRDAVTLEPFETWTYARGCAGEMPTLIAPVLVGERELVTLDYSVDLAAYFPDGL